MYNIKKHETDRAIIVNSSSGNPDWFQICIWEKETFSIHINYAKLFFGKRRDFLTPDGEDPSTYKEFLVTWTFKEHPEHGKNIVIKSAERYYDDEEDE